jgi:hypothetical protein
MVVKRKKSQIMNSKKITRMINGIKEMYKQLNDFKEVTITQREFSKHLNEIKKTMQDVKEEFSEDTEILKKIKLKSGK